jgi:endogenous inhibitor of DNA gyrase (YacG/DUF329 family)
MSANAPRPCPICGKPAAVKHRPFCSARCATIDLGRWLKGDYRVPTQEAPDETARDEAEE